MHTHFPQPRHVEQFRHTTALQPETGQRLPPSSHLPDHIVLASYCLMTNFPPKLAAQSNSIRSQRMWVRNPRAGLSWFQFKVSPEISGRTSAEDPGTRRLNCGWRSGFLTGHWQEASFPGQVDCPQAARASPRHGTRWVSRAASETARGEPPHHQGLSGKPLRYFLLLRSESASPPRHTLRGCDLLQPPPAPSLSRKNQLFSRKIGFLTASQSHLSKQQP